MWHGVPFARQRRPIVGVLRMTPPPPPNCNLALIWVMGHGPGEGQTQVQRRHRTEDDECGNETRLGLGLIRNARHYISVPLRL